MKKLYELQKEFLGKYREEKLNIDEINMLIAIVSGLNSKDPSSQVGSCITTIDKKVLSTGCNNNPKGWDDKEFPWGNDFENGEINTKYPYIIHAEMNTIMNYNGSKKDLENGIMYVTLFPCSACAKIIASSGIKKLIYIEERGNNLDNTFSRLILSKCGIECISFDELKSKNIEEISIDFNSKNIKENVKIKKYEKIN